MSTDTHLVTGAFGYSGRAIAERLLAKDLQVRTLTGADPSLDPLGAQLDTLPIDLLDDPNQLAVQLKGVRVLYNTYWVRFTHKDKYCQFSHADAVRRSKNLFHAAQLADVERIVHVSITNPSLDSPLPYFRGKAEVEQALCQSGIPHTILRPAVLFGNNDILIHNIAWTLRHFPVFGMFGGGHYRLQPIHIHDFADLAVRSGQADAPSLIHAVGPEDYSYRELIHTIARSIGVRRLIVPLPPNIVWLIGKLLGTVLNDVTITRDEIKGIMDNLLHVPDAPPAGTTRLSEWLNQHHDTLGCHYHSELKRRRLRFTTC